MVVAKMDLETTVIEHIVLFRLRSDAGEADIERMRAGLFVLRERIPGILDIAWGGNVSPEGKGRGYTRAVIIRFADVAARDAYLPHPDHLAVVPLIEAVAAEVLVFDLQRDGA